MKKLFCLSFLLFAGCADNRVGEDFWYTNADILCQRQNCPRCHETRGITCPNCTGTGQEACRECGGDGEVRCSACGGSGVIGLEKCATCAGTGEETCGRCGGDGLQTCHVCSGKKLVACIQRIPVDQGPVVHPEDAWPPNNYQGGGVEK